MRGVTTAMLLTLDRISAERRILLADFERFLVLFALVPFIKCLEAFPNLNGHTFWRRPFNCIYRFCSGSCGPSYEQEFCASRFDGGLSLRGELFSVSLRVRHVDFRDKINRRLTLGMQSGNRHRANESTREHS